MAVNTWIIVAGEPGVKNLVDTARQVGGYVRAVVVGARSLAEVIAGGDVDEVAWIEQAQDVPVEAYAAAVRSIVAATPGIVMAGRRPGERVLLGAAAAGLKAPVLLGASSISATSDEVVVTHTVFGGIAEERVVVPGPVALVLDGGGTVARTEAAAAIHELVAQPFAGVAVVERAAASADQVDLASASRVVGIGRGLKKREDLALISAVAGALRAEIGCTRPLSEGLDWLPRNRYIGISGQHIAPRLYLAVGLSGQIQHVDGVRNSEIVVALNTDSKAPIMDEADYVLVGDLYELIPAITAALGAE